MHPNLECVPKSMVAVLSFTVEFNDSVFPETVVETLTKKHRKVAWLEEKNHDPINKFPNKQSLKYITSKVGMQYLLR